MDFEVELSGGAPWGFRIQGGKEFHSPIKITFLKPGGKASRCQELKVGDLVTHINQLETSSLTHTQAEQQIKRAGTQLKLNIHRKETAKSPEAIPKAEKSEDEVPVLENNYIRRRSISSTGIKNSEALTMTDKEKDPDWYKSMFKNVHQAVPLKPVPFSGEAPEQLENRAPVKKKASIYETEVERANQYHAERSRRPSRKSLTGKPQTSTALLELGKSHEQGAPIRQYDDYVVDNVFTPSPSSSGSTDPLNLEGAARGGYRRFSSPGNQPVTMVAISPGSTRTRSTLSDCETSPPTVTSKPIIMKRPNPPKISSKPPAGFSAIKKDLQRKSPELKRPPTIPHLDESLAPTVAKSDNSVTEKARTHNDINSLKYSPDTVEACNTDLPLNSAIPDPTVAVVEHPIASSEEPDETTEQHIPDTEKSVSVTEKHITLVKNDVPDTDKPSPSTEQLLNAPMPDNPALSADQTGPCKILITSATEEHNGSTTQIPETVSSETRQLGAGSEKHNGSTTQIPETVSSQQLGAGSESESEVEHSDRYSEGEVDKLILLSAHTISDSEAEEEEKTNIKETPINEKNSEGMKTAENQKEEPIKDDKQKLNGDLVHDLLPEENNVPLPEESDDDEETCRKQHVILLTAHDAYKLADNDDMVTRQNTMVSMTPEFV